MEAIVVKGLRHAYGRLETLQGIEFRVEEGEIFGLLGPNGAGKTTTVGILTSQIPPKEGFVSVLGLDPSQDIKKLRRRIGIAGQDLRLSGHQTGREALRFYSNLYGVPKNVLERRIKELLAMVGLESRGHDLVRTYSEGMRRRLNIILALLHDPEILFLDEPTSGLDPHSRRQVWHVLRELKKAGKTIFLTTHYMEEAEYLCDRIALIDAGRIVALGNLQELKAHVGEGKIIEVSIDCGPEIVSQVQPLIGEGSVYCEGGLNIITKHPETVLQEVVRHSLSGQSGDGIGTIHVREPSLEDVFLKLTGKTLKEGVHVDEPVIAEDGTKARRRAFYWLRFPIRHRVNNATYTGN